MFIPIFIHLSTIPFPMTFLNAPFFFNSWVYFSQLLVYYNDLWPCLGVHENWDMASCIARRKIGSADGINIKLINKGSFWLLCDYGIEIDIGQQWNMFNQKHEKLLSNFFHSSFFHCTRTVTCFSNEIINNADI